jgi:hypothetical protein
MTTEAARRRQVLAETLAAFRQAEPPHRYHGLATRNLARWRSERAEPGPATGIRILPGDWGDVTGRLTRQYGACFAVLNMANAFVPGGGYREGAIAQEENMFRRTDCHFRIDPDQCDPERMRYTPAMTRLLNAHDGRVYLDTDRPRVCIRGPEDCSRSDLGYEWLRDDEVFPFFELRAAAQDLRDGSAFDDDDARKRIAAQLDTLLKHGIRFAILSAFGCGAFRNPAERVARIYREEITMRESKFDVIAFAIFNAGYGPDNYTPFAEAMAQT